MSQEKSDELNVKVPLTDFVRQIAIESGKAGAMAVIKEHTLYAMPSGLSMAVMVFRLLKSESEHLNAATSMLPGLPDL